MISQLRTYIENNGGDWKALAADLRDELLDLELGIISIKEFVELANSNDYGIKDFSELVKTIDVITSTQVSTISDFERAVLTLYYTYSQGLTKSRNTIKDAEKEGITDYEKLLEYSITALKLKK